MMLAAVAAFALALPAGAQQGLRAETIRWSHPQPAQVALFRVHWGTDPAALDHVREISAAPQAVPGLYSASILVPVDATVYVALTAVGPSGLESLPSATGVRTPTGQGNSGLGAPGTPTLLGTP